MPRPDLKVSAELYNLDAVAYESLLVGLFAIWKGQPETRPKPNEVYAGFSRDGFHWQRPHRSPLVRVSERQGDWNWGNVQSAGGCFLIVRDKLYFYVSGRAGVAGTKDDGICSTGLATLRRDGFASLRAGNNPCSLTTRLLRFSGAQLFVNVAAANGELRAEILDASGQPAKGCTLAECQPIRVDNNCVRVQWKGVRELSRLHGAPVRFRFDLQNGDLYSFWVSPDTSGASRGFTAAGGPDLPAPLDVTGPAS